MDFDELFVVVVVFPHVVDDTRPENGVQGFVTVNLIRKSIEEAVAYGSTDWSVTCRSVVSHCGWWGRLKGGHEEREVHNIPFPVVFVTYRP